MSELPGALAAWASLPGPAKVIDAIRRRAVAGHSTSRGALRCSLSDAERKQVGRLLGSDWEVSGRPVRLQDLAVRLPGLTPRDLAEAVGGSVVPRAQARASAASQAAGEVSAARTILLAAGVPAEAAEAWLRDPALPRPGSGVLASLTESVAAVWSAVTGAPVHLARLAADVCGDAHALDGDRPLGRAVARLAATVHGLPRPSRSGHFWRAAWAAIGVLCNEVSSRVLTLNLPLRGDAAAVALATARPGEPVWLTLRSLSGPWTAASKTPVYVCENPTIVEAAADVLGAQCLPLVCTDGIASAAALALVGGLVGAGCGIHARADFDRAGLTILDQLRTVAPGLRLWRFDAETYAEILGLGDTAVDFEASMLTRPVHEETALSLLLTDLDPATASPGRPDLRR